MGNQYGGINSVWPVASFLWGRPIRSPGSLICPKKRVTTLCPREAKWSVSICDLPMPCLPASIMFWWAGVLSTTLTSSFAVILIFIKLSFLLCHTG